MKETILTHQQIAKIAEEMGEKISHTLENEEKPALLLCVMKGAMNFFVELMLHIKADVLVDYVQVSSFSGTSSTGVANLVKDVECDIEGRTVIIIEDIVDSGISIDCLKKVLSPRRPKRILVAALIDKTVDRKVELDIDFVGYTLNERKFLVGYGLDYYGLLRNYPDVSVPDEEDLKAWDALLAK
ncbi:MAG: hypoxanthine phosphoribosyltransferase [Bacillota bacterium]|nr:hypoxanthine phosphoribosyltransferase [Bacillota bacterium]